MQYALPYYYFIAFSRYLKLPPVGLVGSKDGSSFQFSMEHRDCLLHPHRNSESFKDSFINISRVEGSFIKKLTTKVEISI